MKIVIYGLGKGNKYIEDNLKTEHEIIGYSDSYTNIKVYKGIKFYKPEELAQLSFDYIIISIRNRKECWKVYELLTGEEYGIDKGKVIPFYVYAKGEYWDICMSHADVEKIEGLILGTSYARHGILPDFLSAYFVNLGVPSQDLFGNLETIKACFNKYGDRLKNLKYILVDMFDYTYFNYDASLCKLFFSHLRYGGIIKKHNYENNSNYTNEFENELFIQLGIKRDNSVTEILNYLFEKAFALDEEFDSCNRWNRIKGDASLPVGHFISHITRIKDIKTIEENKKTFGAFCDMLLQFNPDIKIVCLLLPKYITLEETKNAVMEQRKAEFYEIINEFINTKNIYFWNYKFCEGIADNNRLWFDIEHLNTIGARCMTSIIEEDLKREIY